MSLKPVLLLMISLSAFAGQPTHEEAWQILARAAYLRANDPAGAARVIAFRDSLKENKAKLDQFNRDWAKSTGPGKFTDPDRAFGALKVGADLDKFNRDVFDHYMNSPRPLDAKDISDFVTGTFPSNARGTANQIVHSVIDGIKHDGVQGPLKDRMVRALQGEAEKALRDIYLMGQENWNYTAPSYRTGGRGGGEFVPKRSGSIDIAQIIDREFANQAFPLRGSPYDSPVLKQKIYDKAREELLSKMMGAESTAATGTPPSSSAPGESVSHAGTASSSGRPTAPEGETRANRLKRELRDLKERLNNATSETEKQELLKTFYYEKQVEGLVEAAAAAEKQGDRQAQLEALEAYQNGLDGIVQMIGFADPEAAKAIGIVGGFAAGVAGAIIKSAGNPVLLAANLVGAIGNLLGSLFGGPSDLEVIMAELQEIRKQLAQFEERVMNRLNDLEDNLSHLIRYTFNSLNHRLNDLERKMETLAKESEDRDRQIMDLGQVILKDVNRLEVEMREAAQDSRKGEMIALLNRMTPDRNGTIPEYLAGEGNHWEGMTELQRMAINDSRALARTRLTSPDFSSLGSNRRHASPDEARSAIEESAARDRRQFFNNLNGSYLYGSPWEILPQIHEAHRRLGTPLTNHETLVDPAILSTAIYGISKVARISDPELRKKWLRWDIGTKGTGESKLKEALTLGSHLTEAARALREKPEIIDHDYELQERYIDEFERLIRNEYKAEAKALSPKDAHEPYDLLKGPVQAPTSLPRLLERKENGQGTTIAVCSEAATALRAKQRHLETAAIPIPPSLRQAVAEMFESHERMADEVGASPIEICISDISFGKPRHLDLEHTGLSYDYNRKTYKKLHVTFSVRQGGKELKKFAVATDEFLTDHRIAYIQKWKLGAPIYPGKGKTPGRPTWKQFTEGDWWFGHDFAKHQGTPYDWNETTERPSDANLVFSAFLPEAKDVYHKRTLLKQAMTAGHQTAILARLEEAIRPHKKDPVDLTTLSQAIRPLESKNREFHGEVLSAYEHFVDRIFPVRPATEEEKKEIEEKRKKDEEAKKGVKASEKKEEPEISETDKKEVGPIFVPKSEEEIIKEVKDDLLAFKQRARLRLLEDNSLGTPDERLAMVKAIEKHFAPLMDEKNLEKYIAVNQALTVARRRGDNRIREKIASPADAGTEWRFFEGLAVFDSLKVLIAKSLALAVGEAKANPQRAKFVRMENEALRTIDDIESLSEIQIPEKAQKKYTEAIAGLYDSRSIKELVLFDGFGEFNLPFLSPDRSDLLSVMRERVQASRKAAAELLRDHKGSDPTFLTAPMKAGQAIVDGYKKGR